MKNIHFFCTTKNTSFCTTSLELFPRWSINSYHPGTTPLLISITLNKFCLFYNFTNESHSSISVSASFTKNNAFEIYTCCCVYHWALLFYCWLICFLLAPLSHGTFPYLQPPALVVRSNRTLSKDSPSRGRKTCM